MGGGTRNRDSMVLAWVDLAATLQRMTKKQTKNTKHGEAAGAGGGCYSPFWVL